MDFTEINFRGKQKESLGRIDRQNSLFRTAKTTIIKFGLYASFVELESAKSALNEVAAIRDIFRSCLDPNDFTVLNCIVKGHASLSPHSLRLRLCSRFTLLAT
ncbi:hypothetical protein TNCV_3054711 [Trichonephila clavipes]|nr:hypothetical protein TNCV_3054711 [Trichonephila clavipes]